MGNALLLSPDCMFPLHFSEAADGDMYSHFRDFIFHFATQVIFDLGNH